MWKNSKIWNVTAKNVAADSPIQMAMNMRLMQSFAPNAESHNFGMHRSVCSKHQTTD